MRRAFGPAILAFLLLFMQQQAQVHALSHLGSQVARSQQAQMLAPQADIACVECALLAAGSGTAVGADAASASAVPTPAPIWSTLRSRAADVPAYYSSRAPPVLL